jgi:hypothetical protein
MCFTLLALSVPVNSQLRPLGVPLDLDNPLSCLGNPLVAVQIHFVRGPVCAMQFQSLQCKRPSAQFTLARIGTILSNASNP